MAATWGENDKVATPVADDNSWGANDRLADAPKGRGLLGAAKDVGAATMQGLAGLGKAAGDAYGLASGNMDNALSRLGGNAQAYWADAKSDHLKAAEARRSQSMDAADGVLGKVWAGAKETLTDPALAMDMVASNLATMIPGMAVGRAAQGASLARGLASAAKSGPPTQAAIHAARMRAGAVGTGASIGTGAVQQGTDVAAGAYADAIGKTDAQWDASPQFQAALAANGGDREAAKHELSLAAARGAFVPAAATSLMANALPGARYLERALIGAPAAGAAKAGMGTMARSVAKGLMGEGLQEAVEEGGGKLAANISVQRLADENQDAWQGVGESAGLGLAGGLLLGGVGGVREGRQLNVAAKAEADRLKSEQDSADRAIAAAQDAISKSEQFVRDNPHVAWTAEQGRLTPEMVGPMPQGPQTPDWQTQPGAGVQRDGVDFELQVDTSGLSLVDAARAEQEAAQAKRHTIDFTVEDTTPAWSTEYGAAPQRAAGADFPGREFDTGNLGFEQPAKQLGFSPLAGTPVIFADGTVALGSEAAAAARAAGIKPSQALGIDENAGPLSAVAARAVDSGASTEMGMRVLAERGAREAEEAARLQAKAQPKTQATPQDTTGQDGQPTVRQTEGGGWVATDAQGQAASPEFASQPLAERWARLEVRRLAGDNFAARVQQNLMRQQAGAQDGGQVAPDAQASLLRAAEGDALVLQNRNRGTAASIAQMNAIAANPDYLRTGPSRTMDQGAPVVFGDLPETALVGRAETVADGRGQRVQTRYAVVDAADVLTSHTADGLPVDGYETGMPGKLRAVAGNGRAAGLSEGYLRGTADSYRQELMQDAQALGIDPAQVQSMQAPMLVRVMDAADVSADIGDRSNVTSTARLSPVEEAANDARRVDLTALEFDEGGNVTPQAVRGFIQAMPESEHGNMLNSDGSPTRQAYDRLMAAAFKSAYENDALVQLHAQATDPEARTIMAALAESASAMSQLRGAGEFDIRQAVADAAAIAVNARRKGLKLADVLSNQDLDMNPEAFVVARFMAENIRSAKRIADGLRQWAQLALEQVRIDRENETQAGMFGPQPTLSRTQLLERLGNEQQPTHQQPASGEAGIWPATGQPDEQAPAAQPGWPEPAGEGAARASAQRAGDSGGEADGREGGSEQALSSYSEGDLRRREQQRQQAEADERSQQQALERRAQADAERGDFFLTGSDRAADEAEARGQQVMFSRSADSGSGSQQDENERQFADTERAYGGRAVYDKAKAAGKTKLNYQQWVQVRTPAFLQWFGAWNAHENAQMQRQAATLDQAKQEAQVFVGQPLTNLSTGLVAQVSKNNLGKMSSSKAGDKSASMADHALAIANADHLFAHALLDHSHADAKGEPTIAAIHRYVAPMLGRDGALRAVKLTVKETTGPNEPNPVYSIEAMEIENPPSVLARVNPDGTGIHPQAGLSANVRQMLAAVNGEGVSKVVDPETGEPMVVYHGTNADFSSFDRSKASAGKFGKGFYFTQHKHQAETYAYANAQGDSNRFLVEAFVNARNPFETKSVFSFQAQMASEGVDSASSSEHLLDKGHDGVVSMGKEGVFNELVAFHPTQIKSATGNTGAFDAANEDIRFARAWHGTPHRGIEKEGFSLNKIGSGEGAQAYGWGIYFASQKEVAEGYRKKLTVEEDYVDGELLNTDIPRHMLAWALREESENVAEAKDRLEVMARPGGSPSVRRSAQAALELLEQGERPSVQTIKPDGQLYQVEVPEDDDLLDWDKPLSQQPPKVREALGRLGVDVDNEALAAYDDALLSALFDDGPDPGKMPRDPTGQEVYRSLGNPQTASERLRQAGIPGLRYLDGNSRGAGEGSHNYVIWDEALLTPEAAQIEPMYSRSLATKAAYEARIDALFAGGKAGRVGATVLDRSDMLDLLGFENRPVVLQESKVIAGQRKHPNMTAADWKKVPEWLEDPAAVFDSDTVDGALVFIAPELVQGSVVMITVEPDATISASLIAHQLTNAYDKDNGPPPFGRWANMGLTKYVDQKKFPALAERAGLQLPRKALQSQPGMQRILTEKNLAGWRRSNSAAFMFGGQRAQTANQHALDSAKARIEAGEDAEAVRQDTGWHKGTDGKWRFEIDDSQAQWNKYGLRRKNLTFGDVYDRLRERGLFHSVGNLLKHDRLFAAYPQLRGMLVTPETGVGNASFVEEKDAAKRAQGVLGEVRIRRDLPLDEALSSMLHELQHAVQNAEGFARGGSPLEFSDDMLPQDVVRAAEEKRQRGMDMIGGRKHWDGIELQREANQMLEQARIDAYRKLAGEIEARNTQARAGLSADERRATAPSATQDIADSEAIVLWQDTVLPMPAALAQSRDTNGFAQSAAARARVAQVQERVNAITAKWANAPEVVVVHDMQDAKVPKAARDADAAQKSQGGTGEPQGFFFGGKVYIIASQTPTTAAVQQVLFHEALGHYGLQGVFGDRLNSILNRVALARREQVKAKARQYGLDFSTPSQRRIAAEEVLAEMAEQNPQMGLVREAIAAIRSWLRENIPGFDNLRVTNDEIIRSYLMPARRFVQQGAGRGDGRQVSFSRSAMKDTDANIRRGRMALAQAVTEKTSVHRAMFRNGLGWVDFVWGDDKRGIAHIIKRRSESDGMTQAQAIRFIQDQVVQAIASGAEIRRTEHASGAVRVQIAHDNTEAALVRQPGSNAWVLTAFEISPNPAGRGATPSAGTGTAPIRSRHSAVGEPDDSGSASIAQNAEEGNGAPMFSRSSGVADGMTDVQRAASERVFGQARQTSVKERFQGMRANLGLKLRQGLIDQFAAIRELDPKAYMLARLSKGSEGTLEALMLYGTPFVKDGVADVKIDPEGGVARLLADLGGEHDRFLQWMAAQRAELLKAEGRENLMTQEDISSLKTLNQGKMADGRARAEVYMKAMMRLNRINDSVLEVARDSGLLSQDAVDLMKGQPYVPFYRLMEDGQTVQATRGGKGLVNQKAFHKLKGGTQQINGDLLHNLMMNWAHMYEAAAKNRAALATMDAAAQMDVAYPTEAGDKGAVRVMRNGQTEYWQVADPYLLEAVSALQYAPPAFIKPLAKLKNLLTFGITVNPTFKIRSLMRDSIQAMALADLSAMPTKNMTKGWSLTDTKGQTYASMLAGGGVMKFGSMENSDRVRQQIAKLGGKVLDEQGWRWLMGQAKSMFDAYQDFGDRLENVNRAALYQRLREKGVSHADAVFQSRDLMDFSAQGGWPVVRFLTQTVPFLNARLQGLDKLGRSAAENPRRFAAITGAVAMASLALLAINADDEDWKKREDWDRDAYWWFKIGETAFRIPKPFEIGAIGTLAERTAEWMFDKEMTNKRLMERMAAMFSQTFSFNPVPQAIQPLLDVYSNKDSFTGRAIESAADQRLQSKDRVGERTSEVARLLGQAGLPNPLQLIRGDWQSLSPKQIDYLLRGYFGWVATASTAATDAVMRPVMGRGERPESQLREWFLVGNFVESLPAGGSRYVTAMYEQSRQAAEVLASYKDAIKRGDTDKAQRIASQDGEKLARATRLQAAQRMLAELNAQARRIEASGEMSAQEKRHRLDAIARQRHEVAKRAMTA